MLLLFRRFPLSRSVSRFSEANPFRFPAPIQNHSLAIIHLGALNLFVVVGAPRLEALWDHGGQQATLCAIDDDLVDIVAHPQAFHVSQPLVGAVYLDHGLLKDGVAVVREAGNGQGVDEDDAVFVYQAGGVVR